MGGREVGRERDRERGGKESNGEGRNIRGERRRKNVRTGT